MNVGHAIAGDFASKQTERHAIASPTGNPDDGGSIQRRHHTASAHEIVVALDRADWHGWGDLWRSQFQRIMIILDGQLFSKSWREKF